MKKMILASLVLMFTQLSFAAGLAKEAIDTRIKPYAERIEKAKSMNSGDFTKDAKVMKLISDSLDKIVKSSSAGNSEAYIKLINNDSGRSVLAKIAELSSITTDASATDAQKQIARKAMDLLASSAKSIDMLSKNESEAKQQQAKIELALKVSEKIASFGTYESQTAKDYAKAYETALENGKSPKDAMKEASRVAKKEIKEEDITSCTL